MHNIERAILSVSDKTGIIDLARALSAKGVEILSTGGTAKHLTDAGIAVTPIAKWSGAPEILGGRVKTLTPKVFGAILHDRANADHLADVQRLGIPRIDLASWRLHAWGLVEEQKHFTWEEFNALPQFEDVSDFHCVTTWSKFDCRWSGVAWPN